MQPLTLEHWPIDRLIAYARNPRKNHAIVDRMCAAIAEFGFRTPIIAKSGGTVVDGHLRLRAARRLGLAEVPAFPADELTDVQIKAFRLLANRSVAWAEWDDELLRLAMSEIEAVDFDTALTGFDDREIQKLLAGADEETEGLDEAPEPPNRPRIRSAGPVISGSAASTASCAATRRCWRTSRRCSAANSPPCASPIRPTT